MFNCVYVAPHMLEASLVFCEHGIKTALAKGGIGLYTLEMVVKRLIDREWLLWIMMEDEVNVGFFITSYIDGDKPWMEIVIGFINPDYQDSDYFGKGLEAVESFSKALNCHAVLLYSARKGMKKIVKDHDYRPSMMAYKKVLINDTPTAQGSDRH